jgi:hypothetical protein
MTGGAILFIDPVPPPMNLIEIMYKVQLHAIVNVPVRIDRIRYNQQWRFASNT